MLSKQTINNITWIDASSPTRLEVRQLMEEYGIHPLVAEELLSPTPKPRMDLYENFAYLILHFPALRHTHKEGGRENQEVDFILGKNFLITAHYDTVNPIHEFTKVFEVETILEKNAPPEHAGFIFFALIRKLYRTLVIELEAMMDALAEAQERVFAGEEKEMVLELSKISRDLLNFKQAMQLHKEVLETFEPAGEALFGREFRYHLKAISGEYHRVGNLLGHTIDTLSELRETNNSLLTTKQNEVMKVLTIMAFVTFPLSLLANIFGMNTTHTPIVGTGNDFWVIVTMMAFATAVFFVFFRYKKWL